MGPTITVEAAENLRHVADGSLALLDKLSSSQLLQLSILESNETQTFSLRELVQAKAAPTHLLLRAALHSDDWWSYQSAVDLIEHPNATVPLFNALVSEFSRRVPPWLDEPLEASVLAVLQKLFATGLVDADREAALASSSTRVAELVFAAARTREMSFALLEDTSDLDLPGFTSSSESLDGTSGEGLETAGRSLEGLPGHVSPFDADLPVESLDKQLHADLELIRHRDCPLEVLDVVIHFLCHEGVERLGTDRACFGIVLRALADCPAFESKHVKLLRSRFSLMAELWTPAMAASMRSREAALLVLELPVFLQPAVVGVLRANYGVDFDSALEAVTLLS